MDFGSTEDLFTKGLSKLGILKADDNFDERRLHVHLKERIHDLVGYGMMYDFSELF